MPDEPWGQNRAKSTMTDPREGDSIEEAWSLGVTGWAMLSTTLSFFFLLLFSPNLYPFRAITHHCYIVIQGM
jgi:hypothetical protein